MNKQSNTAASPDDAAKFRRSGQDNQKHQQPILDEASREINIDPMRLYGLKQLNGPMGKNGLNPCLS